MFKNNAVTPFYRIVLMSCAFLTATSSYARDYYIQLFSYQSASNAQAALKKVKQENKFIRKSLVNGETYYQVQLGPYHQLQQAKAAQNRVVASSFIRSYPSNKRSLGSRVATVPQMTHTRHKLTHSTHH